MNFDNLYLIIHHILTFWILKKCTARLYSFYIVFVKNDINREAAKISALSSEKINNNEYVTGKELLLSNPRQIIEQAKFAYSPLRKTNKNDWRPRRETTWSFKNFKIRIKSRTKINWKEMRTN